MLERHRRLRDVVLVERVAPLHLQPLRARLYQRIAWWRERQLIDHHQLQRIAWDVHAFPERSRRHQEAASAARPRRTLAEPLDQPTLGPLTLDQHLNFGAALKARLQRLPDGTQGTQRGGEHHGASAQNDSALRRQLGHLPAVGRIAGLGQTRRHIERRLAGVIKGAVHRAR